MNDAAKSAITDFLIALLISLVFFVVAGALLWFAGQTVFLGQLAGAYVLFCFGVLAVSLIGMLIMQLARVNFHDHFNTYVILNVALGALPVVLWSAFAARLAANGAGGFSALSAALLHVCGFLSCYTAYTVVTSQFNGTLYRMILLPLALIGYVVFAVFPWLASLLLTPLFGA